MQLVWHKIKIQITYQRLLATLGLAGLISLSLIHPLGAQTVTQGYESDSTLQRGMVVIVRQNDATKIEPAKLTTLERIKGVVVDPNDSPFTVSNDKQKNFVATVGHYDVLVSNQNGTINSGDLLTISSVEGIAMKADKTQTLVIGKALVGFDGKNAIGKTQLKDSNGANREVTIGRIKVDIGISQNPLFKPTTANVPQILRKVSITITGKEVDPARIYVSLAVLVVTAIIAGSMLFSGVRSSVVSVGRNPLSKKSVIRGLIQVVITSLIIFIVGLFGVYLLLRL